MVRGWQAQLAIPRGGPAGYKLYGEPARLGLLNHGQGHPLPEADFQKAIEWLKKFALTHAREQAVASLAIRFRDGILAL